MRSPSATGNVTSPYPQSSNTGAWIRASGLGLSRVDRCALDRLNLPLRGRKIPAHTDYPLTHVSERTLRIRPRPSVAAIEWTDALPAAGNGMPELIALAGGANLFGETGRHSSTAGATARSTSSSPPRPSGKARRPRPSTAPPSRPLPRHPRTVRERAGSRGARGVRGQRRGVSLGLPRARNPGS